MPMDPVTALRNTRLFRNVDDRELKSIAATMHERSFRPGETAAVEGTGGVGFFVVVDDRAEVTVGGDTRRTLGPDDTVGEIALIDSSARDGSRTMVTGWIRRRGHRHDAGGEEDHERGVGGRRHRRRRGGEPRGRPRAAA